MAADVVKVSYVYTGSAVPELVAGTVDVVAIRNEGCRYKPCSELVGNRFER
jgi:hypothetical protein